MPATLCSDGEHWPSGPGETSTILIMFRTPLTINLLFLYIHTNTPTHACRHMQGTPVQEYTLNFAWLNNLPKDLILCKTVAGILLITKRIYLKTEGYTEALCKIQYNIMAHQLRK